MNKSSFVLSVFLPQHPYDKCTVRKVSQAENFVFDAELQILILDRDHITVLIISVFWDVLTY